MDTTLLNSAQWEAVQYLDGPQLVIAGAGSGKTRVLTYKIAFLLEHGMAPWNILALTFTNKAAREMKERIARQVGDERAAGLAMGTFHSVFARILRREAAAIGYDQRFTIYDQDDSRSLVKLIVREMQLDEKVYVPKDVAAAISRAKEHLQMPAAYRNDRVAMEANQRNRTPQLPAVYERYQERLRQANAMDFDDLLLQTYILFRDHEDIQQRYVQRFQYVLVDEYQDTNYAQHTIVRQLSQDHGHICVVGDDAQSIYSFRGANIDNILQLEQTFPSLRVFKLEQNYRSTQTIVNAANSVIAKNRRQYAKKVFSEKEEGEPIRVLSTYSDLEEADVVVRRIASLTTDGRDGRTPYHYSQIAILYRTNFQSRTFEEALRKSHTPYRIYGGLSFYQRKEVKDVIAYCRMAVNPQDEEALRRIINYPARGIGDTTLTRLSVAAGREGTSLWQVLCSMPESLDVSAGARKKLIAFRELMQQYVDMAAETNADELMEHIIRTSGLHDDVWKSRDPEDISRQENVQELVNACSDFVAMRVEEGERALMAHYLQEVSLLSDLDQDDSDGNDKVTLMTIHSAKGLEFPVVFVVGMEEEIFPGDRALESPRAMEEERRLFYVALTRAGDLCYLSNAKMRRKYGQINFESPSRFIDDIDRRWVRGTSEARRAGQPVGNSYAGFSRRLGPTDGRHHSVGDVHHSVGDKNHSVVDKHHAVEPTVASDLAVGTRVAHQKFGRGTVTAVSGSGMDQKVTVSFESFGQKQLLTRFAKLTIL